MSDTVAHDPIKAVVSTFSSLRDNLGEILKSGRPVVTITLGDRIRRLRKNRGLTLEALASMSGCSKSYLWELENKDFSRPSAVKLDAIATALGVTIDYLYGRMEQSAGEDQAFLRSYMSLPADKRAKLRAIAKLLAE